MQRGPSQESGFLQATIYTQGKSPYPNTLTNKIDWPAKGSLILCAQAKHTKLLHTRRMLCNTAAYYFK